MVWPTTANVKRRGKEWEREREQSQVFQFIINFISRSFFTTRKLKIFFSFCFSLEFKDLKVSFVKLHLAQLMNFFALKPFGGSISACLCHKLNFYFPCFSVIFASKRRCAKSKMIYYKILLEDTNYVERYFRLPRISREVSKHDIFLQLIFKCKTFAVDMIVWSKVERI